MTKSELMVSASKFVLHAHNVFWLYIKQQKLHGTKCITAAHRNSGDIRNGCSFLSLSLPLAISLSTNKINQKHTTAAHTNWFACSTPQIHMHIDRFEIIVYSNQSHFFSPSKPIFLVSSSPSSYTANTQIHIAIVSYKTENVITILFVLSLFRLLSKHWPL